MQDKFKQTGIVLALIILCFSGLFETLYQITPLPAFEQSASDYLADIRERATYAYAAARTLNGAISLLESVEMGPVLVSLQPGQVLEPVNDMIEQFSDLVLVALASVGVQEILLAVLGDVSWTYLLPIALLPALIAPWIAAYKTPLNRIAAALLISVVATRLLIPLMAMGGQAITENYLRADYTQAIDQVEVARQETNAAVGSSSKNSHPLPPQITTPQDKSTFSRPSPTAENSALIPDWENVKNLADSEKLLTLLQDLPDRIITLITIFAFETLVFPLLSCLVFYGLFRIFTRRTE